MKKNGFSLLEIIITIGLVAIFIPAIGVIFSLSVFSASQGEKFSQAYALAQEQMEAIYFLKSCDDSAWDWETTPVNTSIGEYYQLSNSGGTWQLGAKTTTSVSDGEFTKKVAILPVFRIPPLPGGEISQESWAVEDLTTRKIEILVSWNERGEKQEIRLSSYVTKH